MACVKTGADRRVTVKGAVRVFRETALRIDLISYITGCRHL